MDSSSILYGILVIFVVVMFHPYIPCYYHSRVGLKILAGVFGSKRLSSLSQRVTSSERVWLPHVDFNIHQNNSVYYMLLDFSRMDIFLGLFRNIWDSRKVSISNGGVSLYFLKELKPLQAYRIHTFIVDHDRKWMYLGHIFESGEGSRVITHAVGFTKVVFKERSGKTIVPAAFFQSQGFQVPPTKNEEGGASHDGTSFVGTLLQRLLSETQQWGLAGSPESPSSRAASDKR